MTDYRSRARLVVENGCLGETVERRVAAPGRGEALLRVHATSVNYHDLVGIDGGIPGLPVPRVPFSDNSAVVEALGEGVSGFAVGDRVIAGFFQTWDDGPPTADKIAAIVGDTVDGALQSRLVVPTRTLVATPAHLSHEEASTLGCAGLTAWRSLVVEAALPPGSTVVLQGTGGGSLYALGIARMMGVRAIVTSSSDEKLARARDLGADAVVNYRTTPDWASVVREVTAGAGADLVVDLGGADTLGESVRAARVGGHVSVIGVLSGPHAPDFPLDIVMARNLTVRGLTVGSTTDLRAMCRAVDRHAYRPVMDETFGLSSAHDALAALRAQRHFGKITISIDD